MRGYRILPYWDAFGVGVTVFTPLGVLFLKSPRAIALFSERYGYTKTLARLLGWRLLWRKATNK